MNLHSDEWHEADRRIDQKKCVGRITDYQHKNVTTDVWPTYQRMNHKGNGNLVTDVTELLGYMFILIEEQSKKKQRPSLQTSTTVTIISDERME